MLNHENIKSIATETNTSKTIFDALERRQRYRRQTNLSKFESQLLNNGEKIVNDEYLNTFKKLETAGVGSLIIGRRGKPNRFVWNYSLKDVAKAAKEEVNLSSLPKMQMGSRKRLSRGRPPKVTPTPKRASPEGISVTINLKPTVSPQDLAAFLDLANSINK